MRNFPCVLQFRDKEHLTKSIKEAMRETVKEAYEQGLKADNFVGHSHSLEWQVGENKPCPECERIINRGYHANVSC